MRKFIIAVVFLLLPVLLPGATLTMEGTYTCQWQSSSPKAFKGNLESSGADYVGDILAPWNKKDEIHTGKLTSSSGNYSGDFIMQSSKRRFTFSISTNGGSCDVFEGRTKVGVLNIRFSGGSFGTGGFDYSELVSAAVSKNTEISKDKVLALFEKKGSTKEDIISVCAVSEVIQGDLEDLYTKKKKVNTNYEFIKELKMDKETAGKVNELIKKIKDGVEAEKKKKK